MKDIEKADSKDSRLREYLAELGSVAVAFSGGVDSTFLLKTAHEVLKDKAVAVTIRSFGFPQRELKEACEFAEKNGIEQIFIDSEEMSIPGFCENPPERCYLCKKALFTSIKETAAARGLEHVIEGSNLDDDGDYRPGHRAIAELDVKSPLRHVGMTKKEIRRLSREMGLPTWDKQSFACLYTRFPYGEKITPDRLSMIDRAEQLLLNSGFKQLRVRFHGNLARIETDEAGFDLMSDSNLRRKIYKEIKEIGFTYVSLDLAGYRTGSMNETLQ